MISELERMWKEASHGLIQGTILVFTKDWEKQQKNLSQDSQSLGWNLNPGPPGVTTT